jgi:hypothetical protein
MELIAEIDSLLTAIDQEISLLNRVTTEMSVDLDTRGTQDMVRWLDRWEPFPRMELPSTD